MTKVVVINIMLITDGQSDTNLEKQESYIFLKFVINNMIKRRRDNMEKIKKEEIQTLLIDVDMIKGFVTTGNLHDSYIKSVLPEQIKWIEKIRNEKGGAICFMIDTHNKNSAELKPGRFLEHCIMGTEESELIDELKGYEDEAYIYHKNSTNGVYAKGFLNDINCMRKLREVIIMGCCSDICVANLAIGLKTYFDQYDRDIEIKIPEDTIETFQIELEKNGQKQIIHDRHKYTEAAWLLMEQAGIQKVKKGGK